MRLRWIPSILLSTLLATAGTATFAQNAAPQVMPAPVAPNAVGNSVSVIRSGTYYEDHARYPDCGSVFLNCILSFATTPSDKFLTITNIDCSNTSSSIPTFNTLVVSVANGYARTRALPNSPANYGALPVGGNGYFLNFNALINFKIGVSKSVYINFFRSTSNATPFTMDCTLTGTLSDPEY